MLTLVAFSRELTKIFFIYFCFFFSAKESLVNLRQLRICFQREKNLRRFVTERLEFKFPRLGRTRAFREIWSSVFDS